MVQPVQRALKAVAYLLMLLGLAAALQLFPLPPERPAFAEPNPLATRANRPATVRESELSFLPEFQGITEWLNSEPLTMEQLQGKVVLVGFLSYSCVNVLRTLPYVKQWEARYASLGLVVLGVHTPQWEFERDPANVRQALERYGITWPVALDNDYMTWDAYGNQYWPHIFLADGTGRVRYHHVGEGNYRRTERWIQRLLREAGSDVSNIPLGAPRGSNLSEAAITRELYAGRDLDDGEFLGDLPVREVDGVETYLAPSTPEDGRLYLSGAWVRVREYAVPAGPGDEGMSYVLIRYTAAGVNTVAAPRDGATVKVRVELDGKPVPRELAGEDIVYSKRGRSFIRVDAPRLYNLVRSTTIEEHELKLATNSSDFHLYTFAFTPS